jgi:ribulose-phosphate 3-epimerase
MKTIEIAPSILSADPLKFGEEIKEVENSGADWHHIDVMDGHFVPNLTFGLGLIKSLKKKMDKPLDVHIMVSNPDEVAMQYVEAGADMLTFHVEAATHAHRIVQSIKAAGKKAGLVVNPGTPIESVYPLLNEIDCVMLMSVNPGFGGQSFIKYTVDKCRQLSEELKRRNLSEQVVIEVDGGINQDTIKEMYEAGARMFVAGSAVYSKADRKAAIQVLRDSV